MHFEEKLCRYADLLICHGLNVQPEQCVYIHGELIHRELAALMVESAYRRGAKYVGVELLDPYSVKTRLVHSQKADYLTYVPAYIPFKYDEMVRECAASIRLIGSEEPDLLCDVNSQQINTLMLHYKKSLKAYYDQGVGKSLVHWTVAGCATPKWAKKVFPELNENAAYQALWEQIFHICHVDEPNYLEVWQKHNELLHDRAERLTQLKIHYLHFTGPETDLKVFLSPQARFIGGGSMSPRNVEFEPNIPTEECFTTPDYRKTEGHVSATRPFMLNGQKVEGLKMIFSQGRLVEFEAKEGGSIFEAYINSDRGARFLGEVALVGVDSPIFASGRLFHEVLYDENAACHIAIGFAYSFCLEGGSAMSAEELDATGCNTSSTHADMMISNEQVDVTASTYSGETIALLRNGQWVW